MKRRFKLLGAVSALILLFSAPAFANDGITLSDISFNPFSQSINIKTNQTIRPKITKVKETNQILLDFPEVVNSLNLDKMEIGKGYIKNVLVSDYSDLDDKNPYLEAVTRGTRITIELKKDIKYNFATSYDFDEQNFEFISLEYETDKEPINITNRNIEKYTNASLYINKENKISKSKNEFKDPKYFSATAGKLVVLDAGHGGNDPGAIGPNGSKEKDISFAITSFLRDRLVSDGMRVLMPRVDDSEIYLKPRVDLANNNNADLFVSIHLNSATSSTAQGIETYYRTPQSSNFAKIIHKNLMSDLGRIDRGVKTANFYVIKRTTMPSVLIETGFISNPQEESLLASTTYQKKFANAVHKGIKEYFYSTRT